MFRGSSVTKYKLTVTLYQLVAFPGNPVALCHLIGVCMLAPMLVHQVKEESLGWR